MNDEAHTRLVARLGALRTLVQQVDQGALSAAFAALEQELDLGEARRTRVCSVCGSVGMSDATRCGTCWTKLTPLSGP